jgi:HD-like signal output (HDOD) protein
MSVESVAILTPAQLLNGDVQLASSPNIYFALKRVIDDPAKGVEDAAEIIEFDAALAARLLKLVNSALYGFSGQVGNIAKAIQLIGLRELQNLLIGMIIVERFSDLPGQQTTIHDFWACNIRCALIARSLDQILGERFAESAFVCGLLHNIGQMVFYRKIPILAREVDLQVQAHFPNPVDELAIEHRLIGFDRFEMGAALCKLWNFPEVICESIRLHSYPNSGSIYDELTAIMRLAQQLSRIDQVDQLPGADFLSIEPQQLSAMLDQVHLEFEVIFKLFYPIN